MTELFGQSTEPTNSRSAKKLQTRQSIMEAALTLRLEKGVYANVSLREVSRVAGMVPTAFYRHFKDMDDLGLCLADEAAQPMLLLIEQIKHRYHAVSGSKSQFSVLLFIDSVEQNPLLWDFLIGERWGGNTAVCQRIEKAIRQFQSQLVDFMETVPLYQPLDQQEKHVFADILINLFFSWGMSLLNVSHNADINTQQKAREDLKTHIGMQIRLLMRGILDIGRTP